MTELDSRKAGPESEDPLLFSIPRLVEFLKTSTSFGLGSSEADKRLGEYGRNELARRKRLSSYAKFLRLAGNPLVTILLLAGAISGFLGEVTNAVIIFSIVVMSTGLMIFQESKAENAAEELRERVALTVTVLRDGEKKEVKLGDIVPGDIVFLTAGDVVPADCKFTVAKDLFVNQSALTGESFPVEKIEKAEGVEADVRNHNEVRGKIDSITDHPDCLFMGTSIVSGFATAIVVKTGNHTEFGKISTRLVGREPVTEFERGLGRFGFLITQVTILLVLFVFLVNALYRHGILESLLFAIALAVGLTPELLPMILSVNLSKGAVFMERKGVIVKRLASIQNFGSMDVLCTDKTGTLTKNEMNLIRCSDPFGLDSNKVEFYAYLNSLFETGLENPLDAAILLSAEKKRIDSRGFHKVDEIPFDFVRRRVSIVVSNDEYGLIITKGAPEDLLKICQSYESSDEQINEMNDITRRKIIETFEAGSSEGLRLLGIAYRRLDSSQSQKRYSIADERSMIFLGYLAFFDPPKDDARESLRKLERSHIQLKILTGDNEIVARNACEKLGFKVRGVVIGSEIAEMHDDALARVVEKANLFARVNPIQKNRIMNALRSNGHVVGFLGDGINDAPSLRASDVGISVDNAVDVAKATADIILLQKNISVLNDGVLEGRRTFGNTMKYVLMGISSNFGNMFSMAGASLILPFLPMLPTQILLNNLLYDVSESTIPTDNVDKEYLERPKRLDISYIRNFMLLFGLVSSIFDFLTFFLMILVFKANAPLFQTAWFLESFSTQTLVIFAIRTRVTPFYKSRPSRFLSISTLSLVALAFVIPLSPIGPIFGFVHPPLLFFAFLVLYVVAYLALVEIAKRWFYKRYSIRVERIRVQHRDARKTKSERL